MRILVIGNNNKGAMEHFVTKALTESSNHQINHLRFPIIGNNKKLRFILNYFSPLREAVYQIISKKIIRLNPQIIIIGYRDFDPRVVADVKKKLPKGTSLISLNSDHISNLYRQESFLAPYDLYLVKDKFLLDILEQKLGKKAIYWHESCPDEYFSWPVLQPTDNCVDVISMGSLYPYRLAFMKNFIQQHRRYNCQFTFKCFYSNTNIDPGGGFFERRFFNEDDKKSLTGQARIVINNLHYAEIMGLNMKFWEYAAIGIPQLIDYKDVALEGLPFDLAKIMFKNIPELIDKIEYYLENYNLLLSLTMQLREYVQAKHAYSVKYSNLISGIEKGTF